MSGVEPPQRHYDRALFAGLAAPDPGHTGSYEGVLVGSALVRWFGPFLLGFAGMRGWYGKRFFGDGRGINLFGEGPGHREGFPMAVEVVPSKVDGKPVLALTYGADEGFPWPRVRDELRVLEDGWLLGMMVVDLPLVRGLATPFLLRRMPDDEAAR